MTRTRLNTRFNYDEDLPRNRTRNPRSNYSQSRIIVFVPSCREAISAIPTEKRGGIIGKEGASAGKNNGGRNR